VKGEKPECQSQHQLELCTGDGVHRLEDLGRRLEMIIVREGAEWMTHLLSHHGEGALWQGSLQRPAD
jgi:hypothetical protein